MSVFRRPDYRSETTLFLQQLHTDDLTLTARQREGHDRLRNKQINLSDQHDMRLGQVPQDAHAFYVNNLAPVKVVLPDFWNKD